MHCNAGACHRWFHSPGWIDPLCRNRIKIVDFVVTTIVVNGDDLMITTTAMFRHKIFVKITEWSWTPLFGVRAREPRYGNIYFTRLPLNDVCYVVFFFFSPPVAHVYAKSNCNKTGSRVLFFLYLVKWFVDYVSDRHGDRWRWPSCSEII